MRFFTRAGAFAQARAVNESRNAKCALERLDEVLDCDAGLLEYAGKGPGLELAVIGYDTTRLRRDASRCGCRADASPQTPPL